MGNRKRKRPADTVGLLRREQRVRTVVEYKAQGLTDAAISILLRESGMGVSPRQVARDVESYIREQGEKTKAYFRALCEANYTKVIAAHMPKVDRVRNAEVIIKATRESSRLMGVGQDTLAITDGDGEAIRTVILLPPQDDE
jgi:homoserine acetyltransferase